MTLSSASSTYPRLEDAARESVAEHLLQVVVLRHGQELGEDQIAELRRRIDVHLTVTAALHSFKLTNDQEPAFVVRPGGGPHD